MTTSLLLTGGAGLYFATFPAYEVSLAIHAFWGVTITLLFWGAMIRATRNWAPAAEQGRAFGILESGRGIEDDIRRDSESQETEKLGLKEIVEVIKMPVVWLIAIVILTGYCAYWGTFRFTSYATDIFMLSVTIAATISVGKVWLKPLAALVAGFIADKLGIAKTLAVLFVVLIISFILFAILPGAPNLLPVMLMNVAVASLAVFAMRGIYFALFEEGGIPLAVTGTAAGIVSTIGYTPDIFMPLLGGVLLDTFPGATGYRYFFLTTAAICGIGLTASLIIFVKYARKRPK